MYRVIEGHAGPGGVCWYVDVEGDEGDSWPPPRRYSTREDAEAAKTELERREAAIDQQPISFGMPLLVTVYRFQRYDIVSDEVVQSRRWATREAIKSVCAEVIEDTRVQVDAGILDGNGMTERNFNPWPRRG